jgi:hypothetical protein
MRKLYFGASIKYVRLKGGRGGHKLIVQKSTRGEGGSKLPCTYSLEGRGVINKYVLSE